MEGEDDCVVMCNTFVNSCWEAPSTKKTVLRWHWICPYAVQFPLFDELCFTSWTAKQRLQVPIPKKPQSVQLLERDLHVVPKLEQMPLAFYQYSPWSHFLNVFVHVFLYLRIFYLPDGFLSNYRVSSEETSDTSGMGCIMCSLSSGIFWPKCKVSEEHGFRKQVTVSP